MISQTIILLLFAWRQPKNFERLFILVPIMICCRKSAVIGVQPLHTSWSKKQQVRMEQKLMKVYEKELKDEAKKQKEVRVFSVCVISNNNILLIIIIIITIIMILYLYSTISITVQWQFTKQLPIIMLY